MRASTPGSGGSRLRRTRAPPRASRCHRRIERQSSRSHRGLDAHAIRDELMLLSHSAPPRLHRMCQSHAAALSASQNAARGQRRNGRVASRCIALRGSAIVHPAIVCPASAPDASFTHDTAIAGRSKAEPHQHPTTAEKYPHRRASSQRSLRCDLRHRWRLDDRPSRLERILVRSVRGGERESAVRAPSGSSGRAARLRPLRRLLVRRVRFALGEGGRERRL